MIPSTYLGLISPCFSYKCNAKQGLIKYILLWISVILLSSHFAIILSCGWSLEQFHMFPITHSYAWPCASNNHLIDSENYWSYPQQQVLHPYVMHSNMDEYCICYVFTKECSDIEHVICTGGLPAILTAVKYFSLHTSSLHTCTFSLHTFPVVIQESWKQLVIVSHCVNCVSVLLLPN